MDRRSFLKTSGAIAMYAASFSAAGAAKPSPQGGESPSSAPVNPFEREGTWYKAALHVHTTTSDGDVDAATRIAQYRELGYDVVALTDHWKTNDVSGFSDDRFLAISGMEAHPKPGTGASPHHFVCLNLPHPFELSRKLRPQELIDRVRSVGGKVIYAHPYWTAHTLEEMFEVTGYIGVEVYNGVCDYVCGKGYGNVHWDQVLNKGRILPATAVDDVHKTSQINRGWTMIRAKGLNTSDIIDAIARGSYYASCGPTIHDCRIKDGVIHVTSSPAASIRFMYNGKSGGRMSNAEEGETITRAEFTLPSQCKWIRVEVIDSKGKYAWTNPIVIDA